MAEWEVVIWEQDDGAALERVPVPGGHMYKATQWGDHGTSVALAFVPSNSVSITSIASIREPEGEDDA